jgi:hypothetical protein
MTKLCQFENCRNRASYAEFYGKPIRCKTHKNNLNHQYRICNCGLSRPCFNLEGQKAKFCNSCKTPDMINVINKKCVCGRYNPNFNFEGLVAKYCFNCKLDGMIDTKHKKCICGIARPTYNFVGFNAEYCIKCKLNDMVDVSHEKCNCGLARPSYNLNGLKAKYCINCKTIDMIDVINKKCKANYCLGTLGNKKYKGYCSSCYQQLFPTDPLTYQIRSKTKEIAVRDFINQNFKEFQHDIPLWSGTCDCTHRRRIDHRTLIGNTLLCIETDEHQHKYYNKLDEEIRYDDLYMLHSGKFIFIRFNPDKFNNKKGKTINPMLYTRLPVLKKEIENQIQRIVNDENNNLLEIIKLYYDSYV